jgi:hypothetical protein
MASKKTIGIGAGIVTAGGVAVAIFANSGNLPDTGNRGLTNAVQAIAAKNIEEYQARPCAFRAASGKHIRVVGVESDEEQPAVVDSELGRVIEVAAIPNKGLCPFVIHAAVRTMDKKRWPDIDGIKWGMRPVQIDHSEKAGDWAWNGFVEGQQECEKVLSHANYLGSSMQELLALPDEWKRRLLKVDGICNFEGQDHPCSVPWGDPRAVAGSKIRFPHRLSGRPDINLVEAASDGTPDDRVSEPDGGWGAEIPDEPQELDGGKVIEMGP